MEHIHGLSEKNSCPDNGLINLIYLLIPIQEAGTCRESAMNRSQLP
jgi:hypothetical protein